MTDFSRGHKKHLNAPSSLIRRQKIKKNSQHAKSFVAGNSEKFTMIHDDDLYNVNIRFDKCSSLRKDRKSDILYP